MSNAIAELDKLSETLADLATVPSRAARGAAEEINRLIGDQFATATDPYGGAWEALMDSTVRRKHGDTRILIRSGAMRDETYARPAGGAGLEVVSVPYGSYHQTGTEHMARRAVLPDEGELPEAWEEAVERAIEKAFGGR
jgi:hypothetical protein